MSKFFIDRPIFAWVIAIVIMLAGVLSILRLPVAQYPTIAPPQVAINATYPGASAKTVEDSVTQIIEQKMQGIDNLTYMSSSSDDNGGATITLTFNAGTNPDIAQVQVQNKLQSALSSLPSAVQEQGVTVTKSARNFLMVVGVVSEDGRLNATIVAQTRLSSPEAFGKILLKVNTDGSRVLLRDVARIELGAESYRTQSSFNGKPSAGIAIKLASGANALDTAEAVRAKVTEMSGFFPKGLKVVYPYDTTPFVKISIEEVVKTLAEAVVLVGVVMYVFLQNFRATLIPTIAVPVVLLGTFGVMAALGFSINTLTMFGMVLAIGLLVDDAIVVVENVERVMNEEGLPPREATRKSMGQITGALIGIALVLAAVFVPMAFFSGSTGVIYRQFAITIVSAMVLSVLVAMVFTPALCATLLKRSEEHTSEL